MSGGNKEPITSSGLCDLSTNAFFDFIYQVRVIYERICLVVKVAMISYTGSLLDWTAITRPYAGAIAIIGSLRGYYLLLEYILPFELFNYIIIGVVSFAFDLWDIRNVCR